MSTLDASVLHRTHTSPRLPRVLEASCIARGDAGDLRAPPANGWSCGEKLITHHDARALWCMLGALTPLIVRLPAEFRLAALILPKLGSGDAIGEV